MVDSKLKRWLFAMFSFLGSGLIAIPTVQAEPVTLTGSLNNRFSDNARRASSNEQSDLETRVSVSVQHIKDPGRCNSNLDGTLGYGYWLDDTYDPRLYTNIGFQGDCELVQGLDWTLSNRLSDVRQNSRRADAPDNTTRKNVFNTGPRYSLFLTQRDQVQFSIQYQQTEFEEPEQTDSDRVIGLVNWNHLFSSTLNGGIAVSSNQAELDSGVDIDVNTVSVTFAKTWPTTELTGSLGVSEIETVFDTGSRKSDGVVGDLSINREINPSADFYFTASRELTDQTSNFDFQFGEFEFNLTETEAVEITALSSGIEKMFSDGTAITAGMRASRSLFLSSQTEENRVGLNVSGVRPLNSRVSLTSGLRLDYLTYEEDDSEDSIVAFDVGVSYSFSRDLDMNARLGHERRSSDVPSREYQENWILLGLSYRFL